MEFTIESCVREYRFSKEFCTPKERGGLSVNVRKAISDDVYTATVKIDGTKAVQSKRNNDLLSFQLHLIVVFVLTQGKLTHGPVKFPARSISHFVMNIMAKDWLNRQSKFSQMTYFQQSAKISSSQNFRPYGMTNYSVSQGQGKVPSLFVQESVIGGIR